MKLIMYKGKRLKDSTVEVVVNMSNEIELKLGVVAEDLFYNKTELKKWMQEKIDFIKEML